MPKIIRNSEDAEIRSDNRLRRVYGIRFPDSLDRRLDSLAKREGNGVSAVVRRLVSEALAAHDGGEAA